MIIIYSFTAVIMLATLFLLIWGTNHRPKKEVLAFAKTKTEAEGLIFGLDSRGRYVYSPIDDELMLLIVGGSGSAKTSAAVIPSLKSIPHNTGLVLDISGDVSANVKPDNKLVFEPRDPDSYPYNVFGHIDSLASEFPKISTEELQYTELEKLAIQLMPEPAGGNDSAVYFCHGGRSFLTSALITGYADGKDFLEILTHFLQSSWSAVLREAKESGIRQAIIPVAKYADSDPDDKNVTGCKESADSAVAALVSDPSLRYNLRRPFSNEIALTPKALETHLCFVRIQQDEIEKYKTLINLIITQSLDYLSVRPDENKKAIVVAIDELPRFGRIPQLEGALATLRKRHTRLIIVCQSISQLRSIYGNDDTDSIINNCGFQLLMSVNDPETQKYFADVIGQEERRKTSVTSGGIYGQVTQSTSKDEHYIISPDELGRINADDEAVLIHPGPGHYMRLFKNPYYKDNRIPAFLRGVANKLTTNR